MCFSLAVLSDKGEITLIIFQKGCVRSFSFECCNCQIIPNQFFGCLSDVIGICKSYEDATKITVKSSNREVFKRNMNLMDMSGKMVAVTLWGAEVSSQSWGWRLNLRKVWPLPTPGLCALLQLEAIRNRMFFPAVVVVVSSFGTGGSTNS